MRVDRTVTSSCSKTELHEAKNLMLNASLGVTLRVVRTRRSKGKIGEEGRVNRSKGSNRSNPLTRSAMPDRSGRDGLNANDSWEAVRKQETRRGDGMEPEWFELFECDHDWILGVLSISLHHICREKGNVSNIQSETQLYRSK